MSNIETDAEIALRRLHANPRLNRAELDRKIKYACRDAATDIMRAVHSKDQCHLARLPEVVFWARNLPGILEPFGTTFAGFVQAIAESYDSPTPTVEEIQSEVETLKKEAKLVVQGSDLPRHYRRYADILAHGEPDLFRAVTHELNIEGMTGAMELKDKTLTGAEERERMLGTTFSAVVLHHFYMAKRRYP